ncbi:hypothetical protein UFOVP607_31 [uncultured Caudovirales phage]|uniref:Uncharacterized protein n=1 Tax=uncultured Caudovirales phage TaxID=2100421 RepID=A0A6J5N6E2_9CAUD|nr:hypothetical protein UFOVP607_31 [uncultured Caudovirales phage]
MKKPLLTAHITINTTRTDEVPNDFHYCADCRVRYCKERISAHILNRCAFFEGRA